jgi:hypothetical protein
MQQYRTKDLLRARVKNATYDRMIQLVPVHSCKKRVPFAGAGGLVRKCVWYPGSKLRPVHYGIHDENFVLRVRLVYAPKPDTKVYRKQLRVCE